MDDQILDKMLNIAERFFGTSKDLDQMPITRESFYKLQKLHPKTVIYKLENNEPISWVVVLPTQIELMENFLNGKINERELLNLTRPQDKYEALYLCAAFTMPEHRRKGHILEMFQEVVAGIPHTKDFKIFAWPFSEAGRKLIKKLEDVLKERILVKS